MAEYQVWYTVPVAAHVDTETGKVTRVVVIDEAIQLDVDLDALREECEYDPLGDSTIDSLIAYKDALEDLIPSSGVTLPDFSGPAPENDRARAIEIAETEAWTSWENGY